MSATATLRTETSEHLAWAEWNAIGTAIRLVVTDATQLGSARAMLIDDLAALDVACSRFRDDSELLQLETSAGRPTTVSPVLAAAIRAALRGAQLTDGDVDPTVGRAMETLGYDRDFASGPSTGWGNPGLGQPRPELAADRARRCSAAAHCAGRRTARPRGDREGLGRRPGGTSGSPERSAAACWSASAGTSPSPVTCHPADGRSGSRTSPVIRSHPPKDLPASSPSARVGWPRPAPEPAGGSAAAT